MRKMDRNRVRVTNTPMEARRVFWLVGVLLIAAAVATWLAIAITLALA